MDEPKLGGIFVDFVSGAMAHRRKFGGGRGEAVAKAVGIKGDYLPTWWTRRRTGARCLRAGRAGLPRAHAGASSGGRGAA